MESMELPMTSGIAMNVGAQDETEFDTAHEVPQSEEPIAIEEPTSDTFEEQNDTKEPDIDTLLTTAEEEGEGFEEILTKISEGEFRIGGEESKVTPIEGEIEDEATEEEIVEEEPKDAEAPTEEEVGDELTEKITLLDEKVETLIGETKKVSEKLDKINEQGQMSREEFMAMILMLYKLVKEEEDKKKKISFLDFLIKLIGLFMQSIADPEVLEKDQKKKEESASHEPDSDSSDNILSMMEYLQKRGAMGKGVTQKDTPQMAPEKPIQSPDTIAA